MRRNILIILAGLGLLAVFIFYVGLYPFMRVNGEWVSAKRAEAHMQLARKMKTDLGLQDYDPEVDGLNSLIMDIFVSAELKKEFEPEILENLISERFEDTVDSEVEKAEKELGLEDLKQIILIPQAKVEILRSQFILKDKDPEIWLMETKKSARVTLFSRKFRWDGTSIQRN